MKINFFSTTINHNIQKKINVILKKGNISSGKKKRIVRDRKKRSYV